MKDIGKKSYTNIVIARMPLRGDEAIPWDMGKQYYVYILANKRNTVVYVGVTDNLTKRVWQHKQKVVKGFTQRYNVDKLIYYETYYDPENAIVREKQIKAGSRKKKSELINSLNPTWVDLFDTIQ